MMAKQTDTRPLADQVAQAIGDPGSIVGRKFGPSWGEGNDGYSEHEETVTRWSTRAVLAVLAGAAPDRLYLKPFTNGPDDPERRAGWLMLGDEVVKWLSVPTDKWERIAAALGSTAAGHKIERPA
jgi:hypothetical protein